MSTKDIKLNQKYCFWYHLSAIGKTQNENEYKEKVKRIASFDTVIISLIYIIYSYKIFGIFFNILKNLNN